VPQFLAASFEMLREGQSKMMENIGTLGPMSAMPGFEVMKKQQEAFVKSMMAGWPGGKPPEPPAKGAATPSELDEIKQQLADLQSKLSKMGK